MSYNGTYKKGRLTFRSAGKSLTEQHHKNDCDISLIMRKIRQGQAISAVRQPQYYIDDASIPDYQESLEIIRRGESAIAKMPEAFKRRFRSFPEFLSFIQNPENREECQRLGLVKPEKIKELSEEEKEDRLAKKIAKASGNERGPVKPLD